MACSQGKSGKAVQAMEGIEYLSGQADHGGKLGQAVQASLADKASMQTTQARHAIQASKTG